MKRRIALGFVLAAALLALLVSLVGSADVFAELAGANYRVLSLGLASGALALTFRGLVWTRFIRVVDETATRREIGVVFLTAMFAKYVTPYGQLATEPFVAYLVAEDAEMAYEDGFAGIVSADVLNYVPYYTFGFVGIGLLAVDGTVSNDLTTQLLAFGGLFLVIVGLVYVVLAQQRVVYRIVLAVIGTVRALLGRITDRLEDSLSRETVTDRLDGFYTSVGSITSDRRALLFGTLYAHLGMVFLMLPVYIGAVGLGYELTLPVVAIVVALGKLGFVVPAPGGVGGVEAMVTGGLIALGSLDPAAALTVALIFRVCTYWLTIVIGGTCAFFLLVRP
ncbi:lysylphosphatidylglycerol synthase transmembrane domain-containing protein [Natrialbaceae archaeon A-gly3]